MSDDRRFEREARAWLELGPTDAPDRVIEAALLDIDQTSQERDFRVPWRLPIMSMSSRIAAVVLIAVVGAGAAFAFLRTSPASVGAATPSPSSVGTLAPSPITYELKLLDAGDRASARAVDRSTDAIGSQAGAWETSYNFLNCP